MITVNGERFYFIEDETEFRSVISSLYAEGFDWFNGEYIRNEFPIILCADNGHEGKTMMCTIFNMYKEQYMADPYFKKLIRQKKIKRVLKDETKKRTN